MACSTQRSRACQASCASEPMAWSARTSLTVAASTIGPSVETIAGMNKQSQRLDQRSFMTSSMSALITQGGYHPEMLGKTKCYGTRIGDRRARAGQELN